MAAGCALGRADVVGKYFDDVTKQATPEESQAVFLKLREGMACLYPFVGMPALVPGAFGMVGVIQRKGEQYATLQTFRKPTIDGDNIRQGNEIRKKIYKTAGNSEILDAFHKYFAELCESVEYVPLPSYSFSCRQRIYSIYMGIPACCGQ